VSTAKAPAAPAAAAPHGKNMPKSSGKPAAAAAAPKTATARPKTTANTAPPPKHKH
jgi:hypothetical protein